MGTIFVTGGSGFVGRNIIRSAASRGHEVKALIRSKGKGGEVLGSLSGVEFVYGDIFDEKSLEGGMKGCNSVIHLVGIITEQRKKGITFEKVHLQGSVNVIEAAKKSGIKRFVHMSALGTRPGAKSRYHKTKWAAEEHLRKSGLVCTIFRPSIIFGKEDSFVNMFAKMIKTSPFIPVIAGGKNKIQPIWVGDVAECFIQAVEKKHTENKAYCLGGPDVFTFDELIDVILKVMEKRRIKVNLPMSLARLNAFILENIFDAPPLTKEQLIMLQEDNVCSEENLCNSEETMQDFDLELKPLEIGISEYL